MDNGHLRQDELMAGQEKHLYLAWAQRYHKATRRHFDLRFQLHGALISFASSLPLSLNPHKSIRARQRPNHELKYLNSERRIADGQVGAGPTLVNDIGLFMALARKG